MVCLCRVYGDQLSIQYGFGNAMIEDSRAMNLIVDWCYSILMQWSLGIIAITT